MKDIPFKQISVITAIILLGLFLVACESMPRPEALNPTQVTYDVANLFLDFYESKGGVERLGPAITELIDENGKKCQYTATAEMCYDPNAEEGERFELITSSGAPVVNKPYEKILDRMGGEKVFGKPLANPTITDDGYMEQIYENVVVYSPKDDVSAVHFRPLSKILGMPATPPGQKVYDRRQNVIFYPVEGDLGYHVPIFFDEFIAQHGGIEASGEPISEALATKGLNGQDIARQCFENLCLEYNPKSPQGSRTQLAALGEKYLGQIDVDMAIPSIPQGAVDNSLCLQVSEDKSQIMANEEQTFYLLVYKNHTKEPVANVRARIELMLPDGTVYTYHSDPTGANGWTKTVIPPLPNVEQGTMVAYRVCLDGPVEPEVCVSETYLIWNYR